MKIIMSNSKIKRNLFIKFFLIILLSCLLVLSTYAIVKLSVNVDDNLFQTGNIHINLNDNKAIIEEDEYIFEPGMSVTKDFFVENLGTIDVYYKIYFKNISGKLADVLLVTIKKDEKILYKGTPNKLQEKDVLAIDEILKANDRHNLKAIFYYPSDAENSTQNSNVFFNLGVSATQVKNNSNKEF